jgi:hypothetical protein
MNFNFRDIKNVKVLEAMKSGKIEPLSTFWTKKGTRAKRD